VPPEDTSGRHPRLARKRPQNLLPTKIRANHLTHHSSHHHESYQLDDINLSSDRAQCVYALPMSPS
jgi:hypothetical protein